MQHQSHTHQSHTPTDREPAGRAGAVGAPVGSGGGANDVAGDPDADRSGIGSGLLWAVSGFLIGAAFWHLIGFWGFVSDVVLKGRREESRIVQQVGLDCTDLVLDRTSGSTVSRPCPAYAPSLAEMGHGKLQDSERLAMTAKAPAKDPSRWSFSVRLAEDEERLEKASSMVDEAPSPNAAAIAD